jgi:hypothetical protein
MTPSRTPSPSVWKAGAAPGLFRQNPMRVSDVLSRRIRIVRVDDPLESMQGDRQSIYAVAVDSAGQPVGVLCLLDVQALFKVPRQEPEREAQMTLFSGGD